MQFVGGTTLTSGISGDTHHVGQRTHKLDDAHNEQPVLTRRGPTVHCDTKNHAPCFVVEAPRASGLARGILSLQEQLERHPQPSLREELPRAMCCAEHVGSRRLRGAGPCAEGRVRSVTLLGDCI